jgi:hypothetical protein
MLARSRSGGAQRGFIGGAKTCFVVLDPLNRLMCAIFFWAASTSFRARAMMRSSSERETVRASWFFEQGVV